MNTTDGRITVKSVEDHKYVNIKNREHNVKSVEDHKYVNTTNGRITVKSVEDLKYVFMENKDGIVSYAYANIIK